MEDLKMIPMREEYETLYPKAVDFLRADNEGKSKDDLIMMSLEAVIDRCPYNALTDKGVTEMVNGFYDIIDWGNSEDKVFVTRSNKPGRHSRYSDAQLNELIRRFNAGETRKQLAKEFGMSEGYVSMIITGRRKTGLIRTGERRDGRIKNSPETEQNVIRAIESGMTFKAAGELYGVNPQTVSNICRRAGVKSAYSRSGRKRKLSPEQENELVKDYNNGATRQEMMVKYGISTSCVTYILHRKRKEG